MSVVKMGKVGDNRGKVKRDSLQRSKSWVVVVRGRKGEGHENSKGQ